MIRLFDKESKIIKYISDGALLTVHQNQRLTDEGYISEQLTVQMNILDDDIFNGAEYMTIPAKGHDTLHHLFWIKDKYSDNRFTHFTGVLEGIEELSKTPIIDVRPENTTIRQAAEQVLSDTNYIVRFATDTGRRSSNAYFTDVWSALKRYAAVWRVEMQLFVEVTETGIGARYIDFREQIGVNDGARVVYGHNALEILKEEDRAEIYTALIGRGNGEEVGESEEGDATFGRKINFKDIEWKKSDGAPLDKPLGQYYLELPEATQQYGIKYADSMKPKIGFVDVDSDNQEEVLELTHEALLQVSRPKVMFRATAVYLKGDIGDTVRVVRKDRNIDYDTRIFDITHDRLGDSILDIKLGDNMLETQASRERRIAGNAAVKVEEQINNNLTEHVQYIVSANGLNRNYYTSVDPRDEGFDPMLNDIWYRPDPDSEGDTILYIWNGSVWEEVTRTFNNSKVAGLIQDVQDLKDAAAEDVEITIQNIIDVLDGANQVDLAHIFARLIGDDRFSTLFYQEAENIGFVYREGEEVKSIIAIQNGVPFIRGEHIILDGNTIVDGDFTVTESMIADNAIVEKLKVSGIDASEINVINLDFDSMAGGDIELSKGIRITNNGAVVMEVTSDGKFLFDATVAGLGNIGIADKDTQSGTEIYTDKADDSVVHVEVDGKSYQHAGSGKNLFNVKWYVELEKDLFATGTYELTDEGYLQVNTTDSRGTTNSDLYEYRIYLKPSTDYVFSAGEELRWRIHLFNKDGSSEDITPTGRIATFKTSENVEFMVMKFYPAVTNYPIIVTDIQLEEGTIATSYEPPAPTPDYPIEIHSLNDFDVVSSTEILTEEQLVDYENKINIHLDEPLRSVGDAKDRLFRDSDGLWKVERNVGEIIVDGTESNWTDRTTEVTELNNVNWYQLDIATNSYVSGSGVNTHFSVITSNYHDYEHIRVHGNDNYIWYGIFPPKSMHTNLDEFKLWLKSESDRGNPFTTLYKLSMPTIETLPQELQDKLNNLRSFQNSNYVYTVSDLQPTLHATFKGGGWYERYRSEKRAEELREEIENIEVGGRNLITNSFGNSRNGWTGWAGNTITTTTESGYEWIYVRNNDSGGNTGVHTPRFLVEPNITYVVSFRFKSHWNTGMSMNYNYLREGVASGASSATTVKSLPSINLHSDQPHVQGDIEEGVGARVWFTFSHNERIPFARLLLGVTGVEDSVGFLIREIKIERGEVPSDWTPAPEDTDKRVSDVYSELSNGITNIHTNISEHWEAIEDKVAVNAFTQAMDEMRSDYEQGLIEASQVPQEVQNILARHEAITNNLGDKVEKWDFIDTHMHLGDEGLYIGETDGDSSLLIGTDRISFMQGQEEIAYISGQQMFINRSINVESMQVGSHVFQKIDNNSTIVAWVGG